MGGGDGGGTSMSYGIAVVMGNSYNGSPWVLGQLIGGSEGSNRLVRLSSLTESVDLSRGGNLSSISRAESRWKLQAGEWDAMVIAGVSAVGASVTVFAEGSTRWTGDIVEEHWMDGEYRLVMESKVAQLENAMVPERAYDVAAYPNMRKADTGLSGPMIYGTVTESRIIGTQWDESSQYMQIQGVPHVTQSLSYLKPSTISGNAITWSQGYESHGITQRHEYSPLLEIVDSPSPTTLRVRIGKGLGYSSGTALPDMASDAAYQFLSVSSGVLTVQSGPAFGRSTVFVVDFREWALGTASQYPGGGNLTTEHPTDYVVTVTVSAEFVTAVMADVGNLLSIFTTPLEGVYSDAPGTLLSTPYQVGRFALPGWSASATNPGTMVERSKDPNAQIAPTGAPVALQYVGHDYRYAIATSNEVAVVDNTLTVTESPDVDGALDATLVQRFEPYGSEGTRIARENAVSLLYSLPDPVDLKVGDALRVTWSVVGEMLGPGGVWTLLETTIWDAYASGDSFPAGVDTQRYISGEESPTPGGFRYGVVTDFVAYRACTISSITLYGVPNGVETGNSGAGTTYRQWDYIVNMRGLSAFVRRAAQQLEADAINDDATDPVVVDAQGPVEDLSIHVAVPNGSLIQTAPDVLRHILLDRGPGTLAVSEASTNAAREAIATRAGVSHVATNMQAIACAISTTEQESIATWVSRLCADWGLVVSPSSSVADLLEIRTPWDTSGSEYTVLPGDIVRDSFRGLKQSDIRDLVNMPVFRYAHSEASDWRGTARIQRIKTDPSLVTGATVKDYASGFGDGRDLIAWQICHESWQRYGVARSETVDLWTVPASTVSVALGSDNGTSRIEWLASRHRMVRFGLAVNHAAAFATLGAWVTVSDKRYLKTATRGIVVEREWEPDSGVCTLTLILDAPEFVEADGMLIDTLGSTFDTIVDTLDSGADTIIDTLGA